jgi:hypothetical protein
MYGFFLRLLGGPLSALIDCRSIPIANAAHRLFMWLWFHEADRLSERGWGRL